MKVRFGRRSIQFRFSRRLKANDGIAYKDRDDVVISEELSEKVLLETLLHEAEHIAHPHETERNVTRNGKFYANLLWRMGYRRT